MGWMLLWDKIRKFVVDKEGRAILDGGNVLMPMLAVRQPAASTSRSNKKH